MDHCHHVLTGFMFPAGCWSFRPLSQTTTKKKELHYTVYVSWPYHYYYYYHYHFRVLTHFGTVFCFYECIATHTARHRRHHHSNGNIILSGWARARFTYHVSPTTPLWGVGIFVLILFCPGVRMYRFVLMLRRCFKWNVLIWGGGVWCKMMRFHSMILCKRILSRKIVVLLLEIKYLCCFFSNWKQYLYNFVI